MIKRAILGRLTFAFGLLLFLSLAPTISVQAQQPTPEQQAPATYTRPTSMTRPVGANTAQPGAVSTTTTAP
ncbi:MAG: hypothetical protein ICV68_03720, partial [Pyrinomonadaceae bacterium]|nr:hypothetical protein [Pyrinomonadaceae bacterium]